MRTNRMSGPDKLIRANEGVYKRTVRADAALFRIIHRATRTPGRFGELVSMRRFGGVNLNKRPVYSCLPYLSPDPGMDDGWEMRLADKSDK